MTTLKEGEKAPDFSLPTDGEGTINLKDLKGKKVVVYFYPKDNTPGCTKQACAFRDHQPDFTKLNAEVIGISKDSPKKHDGFKQKHDLNFILASDEDGKVCEAYGVWTEKNLYGRKYMGIQRATFLVDEKGKIEKIWPKVKVPGHAEDVKATIEAMDKTAS